MMISLYVSNDDMYFYRSTIRAKIEMAINKGFLLYTLNKRLLKHLRFMKILRIYIKMNDNAYLGYIYAVNHANIAM